MRVFARMRAEGLDRANEVFALVESLPITIIGAIKRSEAEAIRPGSPRPRLRAPGEQQRAGDDRGDGGGFARG